MAPRTGLAFALAGVLGAACAGTDGFACAQDSQCSGGVCVENACAFPDFVVPAGITSASFSLAYAQNNFGPLDPQNVQEIVKDCLDKSGDGGEQNAFRIDLVDPAQDVFLAAILFELGTPTASTTPDAPLPSPPMTEILTNADAELTAFLQSQEGNLLRLRIAQVESTMPWQIAVDDVSLVVEALQ